MSASLKTDNYGLPLYQPTDTISFIPDWNDLARLTDKELYAQSLLEEQNSTNIQENSTQIQTLLQKIAELDASIKNNTIVSPLPIVLTSGGIINSNYSFSVENSGYVMQVYNFEITFNNFSPTTYAGLNIIARIEIPGIKKEGNAQCGQCFNNVNSRFDSLFFGSDITNKYLGFRSSSNVLPTNDNGVIHCIGTFYSPNN